MAIAAQEAKLRLTVCDSREELGLQVEELHGRLEACGRSLAFPSRVLWWNEWWQAAVPEIPWANARELEALEIKGGGILRELVAKAGGDLTAEQRLTKAKQAFQRTVKEKLCREPSHQGRITVYVPS